MIDGYKKTLLWNAKRPGPHAGGPNQRRNRHIETERLSSYNPRDLARYFVLACKRIGQVERRLAKMRRKYATLHRENKRLRALLASHGITTWKPFRLPSVTEVSDEVAEMLGIDPETLPVGLFGRVLD